MAFNMKNRSKRSGNQSRKNGLRDAHRRNRDKGKTLFRQEMIDGKISGDRFDEDIVSSSDKRQKGQYRDDDDNVVFTVPKVTRTVQLGVPRGKNKFASTNAAGRTTVLEDKFRKGTSENWTGFRSNLRRSMTVESGGLVKKRVEKRTARESYLMSLEEILVEMLRFEVLPKVYAGARGQGQRHRLFNRIKRGLTNWQCVIVPDGGERPTVVFPYRVVILRGTEAELNANWVEIFRPEHDHIEWRPRASQRVVESQEHMNAPAAELREYTAVHEGTEQWNPYLDIPFEFISDFADFDITEAPDADRVYDAEHQGVFSGGDGWMASKGVEFAIRYGVRDTEGLKELFKKHGPMIFRMCTDLYALSLVPPGKRREYMIVRGVGTMVASQACRETVVEIFSQLSASTCVIAYLTAFYTRGSRSSDDTEAEGASEEKAEDTLDAEHQMFGWDDANVGEILRKVQSLDIAPGTVVNALALIVAAGWTLVQAKDKDSKMPVTSIFNYVKKLAGVGKCDTVDDAVGHLISTIPIILSAVSAAVAAKSLAPFFSRKSSLFEDFVEVRAAYDLHKTGQYPNSAFPDRDSFVRALASVHRRFGDEAKARVITPEVKQHLVAVNTMYNEVVNNLSGQFREAPYAVAIVGGSGIGKSVLTRYVADRIIRADGGTPLSKTDIYTQQPTDKYASGYDMSKRVVVLDDLCNQRATLGSSLPSIPTAIIIDTINNVMTPTNQADLSNKGKIFWNPRVVVATSNVLSLGAHIHSNEPVSILRRFNWFIEPTVRKDFRVRGGTGLEPKKEYPLPINDVWTFSVYRWIPAASDDGMKKVYCPELKRDCDVFSLLEFLERDSVGYFAKQRNLATNMDAQTHVAHDIDELKRMSQDSRGVRAEHQMFSWFSGKEEEEPVVDSEPSHVDNENDPSDRFPGIPAYVSPVTDRASNFDQRSFRSYPDYLYTRTADALASVRAAHVRKVRRDQLIADVRCYVDPLLTVFTTIAQRVSDEIGTIMAVHIFLIAFAFQYPICFVPVCVHLYTWKQVGVTTRIASRTVVSAAAVASGVAFVAWLALRQRKPLRGEQQGVVEFTMREQDDVVRVGPPAPEKPTTTTIANLSAAVSRKAVYVTMNAGNTVSIAILTPLRTGLYVGNYHTFKPILMEARRLGEFNVVFTRLKGKPQAHTVPYSSLWTPGYEKADIMFMKLDGPAEVDVTNYLMPHGWLFAMGTGQRMPIRDSMMSLLRAPVEHKRGMLDVTGVLKLIPAQTFGMPQLVACRFPGAPAALKMIGTQCVVATERGDCGSPFFLRTSQGNGGGAYLAGVMAGRVALGSQYSLAISPITDQLVAAAIQNLSVVQAQGAATLFGMPAGMRLSPERVHPSLPAEVQGVVPLGVLTNAQGINTSSQNTFRTRMRKSPFCDLPAVEKQLGPVAHKTPPNPTSTQHFARTVGRMERVPVVESDAERKAIEDLKGQLSALVRRHRGDTTPMSLFDAINGRGDVTPYPMDTSPGFGFKGKKLEFFELACVAGGCGDASCTAYHPNDKDHLVPGRTDNYYPGPELLQQIEDLRRRLLAGEVDLAVFRAALKDESVEMSKEKIRVFFVGMMSLNLIIRQLYTPLLSIMKRDSLSSECAIGMDILSDDWEKFMDFLKEYHVLERLAGDYSNYDNSIHSRLIGAVYEIITVLGAVAGWDAMSLLLMAAIGENMKNPVYIILGMVYRADGTNPSGVAITTWINSLVNSLVHRIAFYTKNPHVLVVVGEDGLFPFQRSVRMGTYGDDVLAAVRALFGIVSITNHDVREAADRLGMTFGPIDKGSGYFPPYYSVDEVSFLKCTDTYVPQLKRRVGMIAQASVRKCLSFERNTDFEARRNTAESALRLFFVRALVEEREEGFGEIRDQLLNTLLPGVERSIEREGLIPDIDAILSGLLSEEKASSPASFDEWWSVDV
jgi:hypothetical protein